MYIGNNSGDNNPKSSKVESVARKLSLLFSDDVQLSEEERDDLCRYLSGCAPELRDAAIDICLASLPEYDGSCHTVDESALIARKWAELAPSLGMNPDMEYYDGIWRARAAEIQPRAGRKLRRLRWRRIVLRAAAVLLPVALVMGGYYVWQRQTAVENGDRVAAADFVPSTIIEPIADSVRHITLSDGTEVTLNRGAGFSYNDAREGELKGEAFFKVAKDPERPFVVHSEHVTVTVLGTEFNFNTRVEDGSSRVALYSGTVELGHATGTNRLDVAGREFTLDPATHAVTIEDFDATLKPSWMDDARNSRKIMTLGEIFDAVESAYGVTITMRGNIDMERRYDFALDPTLDVASVMSLVEFLHGGFSYTIEGNTIVLDKEGE